MSYAILVNNDVFHFMIYHKFLVVKRCLNCDFVQTARSQGCMLQVHRSLFFQLLEKNII